MPTEKLYQNRVVVIGRDYNDAGIYRARHPELKGVEDVTLVSADSHSLAILGGVGGMHVAKAYATPAAHRGTNWEIARDMLRRRVEASGGQFINLTDEGRSYGSL